MSKKVAIIGIGQTHFGELWDQSLRDLILEAGINSLKDANIDRNQINSLFVGNMSAGRFAGQEHVAALAADVLGVNAPATRCEAACASGSVAFRAAYTSIVSGESDISMAIGVEKMTDISGPGALTSLAAAGDQEWEAAIGLTFAGLYALIARCHMHEYGTTSEQMAMVSVVNHEHGKNNPYAQFKNPIAVQDVLASSMVADPLHLLDCSPITDGSAAVILASEEVAKKYNNPIWILGTGQAADTLALHDRKSFTELLATKLAAKQAFATAGADRKAIDLLEVHDCFSINEIIALEDLGFCDKGKGGKFVEAGSIKVGKELPTNTLGGLKAAGHPVGATGIRQLCDITKQLRGNAPNQVKGATKGLNLNIGGSGATAVVNILSSDIGD
ncbi:MAG: thiolase domain-containing protein [Candidatus Aenigmarchaeota archaeon]|nr:thiolase domain-containing protein [Candidatus Aenigmarchaeota archaeon]